MVERHRLQGKMQWVMLSPRNQPANSFQQLFQPPQVPFTPILSQDLMQASTLPGCSPPQENLGKNCNVTTWSPSVPIQRNKAYGQRKQENGGKIGWWGSNFLNSLAQSERGLLPNTAVQLFPCALTTQSLPSGLAVISSTIWVSWFVWKTYRKKKEVSFPCWEALQLLLPAQERLQEHKAGSMGQRLL